jgi:hypothetical protein
VWINGVATNVSAARDARPMRAAGRLTGRFSRLPRWLKS